MKGPRLRALVLAAGRGERLRPLTDFEPKPLLPVAGRPVLEHTLGALEAAGCEATALNLHHLGERIRQRYGDSFGSMPLVYSPEEELLGTLGALGPLGEFFQPADLILVINGDSLCRWPLKRLIRHHQRGGAGATLLLSRRADPAEFGGGVGVAKDGRIVSFDGPGDEREAERRRVFAGAHVISPELVKGLPEGPSDFVQNLYRPLLAAGGVIGSLETSRPWFDVGTPRRFLEASLEWPRGRSPVRWWRRGWRSPGARISRTASVTRSAIDSGASVEAGAEVEGSVLLPGAVVAEGGGVFGSIVGFQTRLPEASRVAGRLITPVQSGVSPRQEDSTLGELVYSPVARRPRAEEAAPELEIEPDRPRPYRLLVFDWDGTLSDSIENIVDCTRATLEELGQPAERAERVREAIGLGLRETVERFAPGCDEELYGRILEVYRRHWISTYAQRSRLFSGVKETLERLAAGGYLLAVATAKGRAGLEQDLRQTGLTGRFHTTRTVDEAPSKPSPEMLLSITDELGVELGESLMIGDSVHDLQMARNAGIHSLAVSSGSFGAEPLLAEEPLACLGRVTELEAWLEGQGSKAV